MSKRRPTRQERNRDMELDRYQRAPFIRDAYPSLATLRMHIRFRNVDSSFSDPKPQEHRFASSSKAFFAIRCPHVECVDGGFDLSPHIQEMIGARKREYSVALTCQGWQDRERINKYHCLLQAEINLIAEYEDGEQSPERNR